MKKKPKIETLLVGIGAMNWEMVGEINWNGPLWDLDFLILYMYVAKSPRFKTTSSYGTIGS